MVATGLQSSLIKGVVLCGPHWFYVTFIQYDDLTVAIGDQELTLIEYQRRVTNGVGV